VIFSLLLWPPFAALISLGHQVLNSADAHEATVLCPPTSSLVHGYRVRIPPGFKSLTQALDDAPSIRVRRHPRLATFPRSMMPLVLSWHPSRRRLSRLLLQCYGSHFGLSNVCSALKIVPMFPPTQLFPLTTSLDPIEFPVSPSLQHSQYWPFLRPLTTSTSSHARLALTSDISEKAKHRLSPL
jgi:hypothetical protein